MIKKILLLFLILHFTTLFAQEQEVADCGKTDNKKVNRMFEKAVDEYRAFRYNEAIKILKDITAIEPDYVEPYFIK